MNKPVSLVVEWDNVSLAGATRAAAMLEALGREIRSCPCDVEVLLCHDAAITPELDPGGGLAAASCRLVPVPDGRYYVLKNRGAAEAHGEIIVFLDSDVIPEPGWLNAILAPFEDPQTSCVAGEAYIDPADSYSRAFGLFWFFPLRSPEAPLRPASGFWANNVAFRRTVIRQYPYPLIQGASRGACLSLAEALARAGITIWSTNAARVSHPPPRRGRHFALRALAQGRDRILRASGWRASVFASLAAFARNVGRGWSRILFLHGRVGLSLSSVPGALLLCFAYYSLMLAGEFGAILRLPAVSRIEV
jgi:glycosyltransferase involved in cell wall biosynthesis